MSQQQNTNDNRHSPALFDDDDVQTATDANVVMTNNDGNETANTGTNAVIDRVNETAAAITNVMVSNANEQIVTDANTVNNDNEDDNDDIDTSNLVTFEDQMAYATRPLRRSNRIAENRPTNAVLVNPSTNWPINDADLPNRPSMIALRRGAYGPRSATGESARTKLTTESRSTTEA